MTNPAPTVQAPATTRSPATTADASGRERFVWNVFTTWGTYVVYVIGGFIMPGVIDRHVGQELLGVWDFGWSLVSYLSLVPLGAAEGVNRFVALHRAKGDVDGVRRTVSTVLLMQVAAALLGAAFVIAAARLLPHMLGGRLGAHIDEARQVVLLLGMAVCIQLTFEPFRGVVSGCHRWDLNNALASGIYTLSVGAMLAALVLGGGLATLAWIQLTGSIVTEIAHVALAYWLCPELEVRVQHARRETAWLMLSFGIRSLANNVSLLFLYQMNTLLVTAHLGAASLAVYARPSALLRHVTTLVRKYAHMLVPTASGLQAAGDKAALRVLLRETGRFSALVTLPMILTLLVLGGPLLELWMGRAYVVEGVLGILAIGHLVPVSQLSTVNIVKGIDAHGRISAVTFGGTIVSIGLTALVLGRTDWGLPGAAGALVLPLTAAQGVYPIVYACRLLDCAPGRFLADAYVRPLLCNAPFAAALITSRLVFHDRPLAALATGGALGGAILFAVYWRHALTLEQRGAVLRRLSRALPGAARRA